MKNKTLIDKKIKALWFFNRTFSKKIINSLISKDIESILSYLIVISIVSKDKGIKKKCDKKIK